MNSSLINKSNLFKPPNFSDLLKPFRFTPLFLFVSIFQHYKKLEVFLSIQVSEIFQITMSFILFPQVELFETFESIMFISAFLYSSAGQPASFEYFAALMTRGTETCAGGSDTNTAPHLHRFVSVPFLWCDGQRPTSCRTNSSASMNQHVVMLSVLRSLSRQFHITVTVQTSSRTSLNIPLLPIFSWCMLKDPVYTHENHLFPKILYRHNVG